MIDDVLDYAGDAEVMGKSLGDDLREGKNTLPLIAAMQRGTPAQKAVIQSALETGSTDLLDQVIDIVTTTGALEFSRHAAAQEARRAIAFAQALAPGPYTNCLLSLAEQLLDRDI